MPARRPSPVLLVTAFEPFGGFSSNPSMEVLAGLRAPPGCRLVRATLPVAFAAAAESVPRILDQARPAAVISLGLAADAPGLRLERLANPLWAEPGQAPRPEQRLEGPGVRHTTLDIDSLAARLCRAGLPSVVSQDAGRYLCNFVYYLVLGWSARHGIPALFIHLPPTPRLAAEHVLRTGRMLPSMESDRMIRAVQITAAQITARRARKAAGATESP